MTASRGSATVGHAGQVPSSIAGRLHTATGAYPVAATLLPFPLTYKGGVTTFVERLAAALRQDFQVDPRVITPRTFRGRPGRPLSQAVLAMQQFRELQRVRPSIVHTHEHPVLLAAALAHRFVRHGRVRVVHTIHVDPAERRPFWKRAIYGWLLEHCTAVTAVSADTARRLINVSTPVPTNVRVIRGAADVQALARSSAGVARFAERWGDFRGPTLCQIGPLNTPLKVAGVVCLISALPYVRERFPEVRLLLVGDGHLRHQVEHAATQHGVAGCVTITGFVDDVALPLALADVYCQITFQDSCPLGLLEAMHAAKPIVASRTGGIPEVIAHGVNGLLVERDPRLIADTIIGMLDDREAARRLAARAIADAHSRFTWKRVASEFAAVYGVVPCRGANVEPR